MEPNKFTRIFGEAEMAAEEAGSAMETAEELGEMDQEGQSSDIAGTMSNVAISALRAIVINKGVWRPIDHMPDPCVEIVFVIDAVGEVITMVRDQWTVQDIYYNEIVGWAPIPEFDELLLEANN